jgi:hypothetical protein
MTSISQAKRSLVLKLQLSLSEMLDQTVLLEGRSRLAYEFPTPIGVLFAKLLSPQMSWLS